MYLDSLALSGAGVFAAELVVLSDDALVEGLTLHVAAVYARQS